VLSDGKKTHYLDHLSRFLIFSIFRWAKQGFGEGVSGHITVADPVLPDHYWMNAFGIHFGRITVSNLVLVSPEGYPVEGGAQLPINTAGFHIREFIISAFTRNLCVLTVDLTSLSS
jgi:ribulose-5-phosphate 4-epimerase/fuculose-1-phosphate aldolase